MSYTTVRLDASLVESLKLMREYPRQSYTELISEMAEVFQRIKQNNQYDEFLHKIQQQKMAELWDNEHDAVWENV